MSNERDRTPTRGAGAEPRPEDHEDPKRARRPVCPFCGSPDCRTRLRKRPRHVCNCCGHEWN